ncbi:MAG: SusC/RagA family TonB-linked outer membrane protein [Chitinophagaceae bacterium]
MLLIKRLSSIFLFLVLFIIPFITSAQNNAITGKVTDENAKPLENVSVVIKGTSIGTTTDANGTYQLSAAKSFGNTLVFSFVGFTDKEIIQSQGNTINVQMEKTNQSLDAVVVVGYGTQKRKDVTGAVASVDRKRLDDVPNTNFAQALQSAIPGLSIDQNSGGAEGNNNTIRIRGRNSISAGTSPLIVLDGIIYTGGISDINPSDIESIDVLKDASAAAIYGSRGANGVIIITSKKGSRGKPVISYNGFYGIQSLSNLPNTLTPEEFYNFKKTREPNSITLSEQTIYNSKEFPNWLALTTHQSTKMQHTLGVSGGGENSRYYVSATFLDVQGIALNDEFKRLSTRVNLEMNIKKWLTYGTNNQLLYNIRDGLPAAFTGQTGAYNFNPLTTPFNADGSQKIFPWPEDLFFGKPLAPTLASNEDRSSKIISNNYLDIKIPFVPGLSYRLNTGVEYTTRNQNTYYGVNTRQGSQTKGDLFLVTDNFSNVLAENIVTDSRSIARHSILFTGLYSYQNEVNKNNKDSATGFPNDVLTYYQANVAQFSASRATYSKATHLSQMARLNYGYNSKYLLTLTARRDGYSAFGANKKYAFFPSVAVGWNISEEKFLTNSKLISNLKLRLSYGSNGNEAVDPYSTLAILSTRSYVDGVTSLPGYIPTSLANNDLGWETTVGFNAGIDFGILNGRIQGSLDVYDKETHDLLLKRAIPSTQGVSSILQNIGKTSNKGLDLGLSTTNLKLRDFTWSSTLSFSFYRNKIKDLYGNGLDDVGNKWFIGHPIEVNYGKIYGGVWQLTDDLTKSPQPGVKPGFAKVVDQNSDGKIDALDDVIYGSRQPDFIYGLGNTFKYKNFQLYLFLQGVAGTTRNNPLLSDAVQSGVRNNTVRKNWWTPTNPTDEYYANALGVNIYGVGILEPDSYARLKDASLSYDLPAKILSQLKVSRLKLYVNARNLFTITKWTGTDPELNTQDGIPLQREFIFGLNISL